MLKEKVFELINLVLVENYTIPHHVEITEDPHFTDDLGMDSLDIVELVMEIENNFGVSIPEELEGAERVSDLLNFLEGAEGLTIPDEVRLTLYEKDEDAQKKKEFVAPIVTKVRFLSEEEVEKMDATLYKEIEEYVNEEIANWTEMCECEEEGEALDFALGSSYPAWRVRNDGTVDVVVHGDSKKFFDFGWEDEDGRRRKSNALDLLRGNVSYKFFNTDRCNNDLDDDLAERVVELFK
jgi:acyl carrier protein